jgi:hypothetical protein
VAESRRRPSSSSVAYSTDMIEGRFIVKGNGLSVIGLMAGIARCRGVGIALAVTGLAGQRRVRAG